MKRVKEKGATDKSQHIAREHNLKQLAASSHPMEAAATMVMKKEGYAHLCTCVDRSNGNMQSLASFRDRMHGITCKESQ